MIVVRFKRENLVVFFDGEVDTWKKLGNERWIFQIRPITDYSNCF